MDHKDKDLILRSYRVLQKSEIHFSTLQYKYRQYAIYWFMGVFAAFGFFMSNNVSVLPANQLFILTCVSIAGSFGLMLIWSIDILLYQKILDSIFIQELEMESEYDFLPQIRHKMLFLTRNLSAIKIQTGFYIGIILLCLLASVFTIAYSEILDGDFYLLITLLLPLTMIFVMIFVMNKKSSTTQKHIVHLKNQTKSK